jgi:alanyl-tRNA synthetase
MSEQDEQTHLYLDDTYLVNIMSTVVRTGERDGSPWAAVRDNIFHPQGGGQPADRGWVGEVEVRPVMVVDEECTWMAVVAIGEQPLQAQVGDKVWTRVDEDARLTHAALHTAGHLVDAATRRRGFTHLVSNHFPGQARIEFDAGGRTVDEEFIAGVQTDVDDAIARDLEVTAEVSPEGRRAIRIGDVSVDECGGTHVARLSELDGVLIRSAKIKKGRLKVGYEAAYRKLSGG